MPAISQDTKRACGYSRNIREVIAFGTSGWSPAVGGIIDPGDCSQTGSGDITRIGDICVTPFASNWACKLVGLLPLESCHTVDI